jgi:hypothetical protein
MKIPAGNVHTFWARRRIEDSKLASDLLDVMGIDATRIAFPPEFLQGFATKASDHDRLSA